MNGKAVTARFDGGSMWRAGWRPASTIRRFKEFHAAAASWSRVERIIARVDAGSLGVENFDII